MKTLLILLLLAPSLQAQNTILWEEIKDFATKSDLPRNVTMANGHVIVGGTATIPPYAVDCVVRVYDQATGTLQWTYQKVNGSANGYTCQSVTANGTVYVSYDLATPNNLIHDIVLRAMNLETGNLLWERTFDTGRNDRATAITATNRFVAIVGYGGDVQAQDILKGIVGVFMADTGAIVMEDRTRENLWQVALAGNILTVTGGGYMLFGGISPPADWFTRVYDLSGNVAALRAAERDAARSERQAARAPRP